MHISEVSMKIIVSNSSGIPIYEQIKEQIKTAIFDGELHDGDMLPSLRGLAKDLKISVITTIRAYNDLADEGFISNLQGKGSFVLPRNQELVRESIFRKIEDSILEIITSAKSANIEKDEVIERINLLWEEQI
jgi:GntR family transcriptional regulator